MNGGIHWPQFHHLCTHPGNKAAIGGSARGQQLRLNFIIVRYSFHDGINQLTARGQEGLAREFPLNGVTQLVTIQQLCDPLTNHLIGEFGAEAEVKLHKQLAGDHIVTAGARLDVGNLHAGRREELISLIPLGRDQLVQRWHRPVNRVIRQMRIGDVALHAMHHQVSGD